VAQGAAYRPKLEAFGLPGERQEPLGRLRLLTIGAAAVLAMELLCLPFVSPRFAVREIRLRAETGVARLLAPAVRLPANTNFLRAPTRLLKERVEQVPAVLRARVARALPNRLVITVERREAVAVIRQAEEALLVDPEGVLFTVQDEWGWGLPELVAPHLTGSRAVSAQRRAELAALLGVLRALGPDPRLRVTRLELVGKDSVEATLESGGRARLGSASQIEVKVKLLAAVLDRLGPQRVEYIDLSDPWAAYWRPRGAASSAAAAG